MTKLVPQGITHSDVPSVESLTSPHLCHGAQPLAASADQMGRAFYTPAVVLLHIKDRNSERRIDSNLKKAEMSSK